jgi:hypothetical protein
MFSDCDLAKDADWKPSRRGFLQASGAGGLGLMLGGTFPSAAQGSGRDPAVILLLLVGGPSQLETFDPKPDAPAEIRGPFRSIATKVPHVRISEHLPMLARRMDRVALIRSLHHDAAPIHETGFQLLQAGRLFPLGEEYPHFGSIASRERGPGRGAPPFVILPGPIESTGVAVPRGQSAGPLGEAHAPHVPAGEWAEHEVAAEPRSMRDAYGDTEFGRNCLLARRFIEAGSRVVTVNMARTVFNAPSWDAHGAPPFSTFDDYARTLLPTFDRAISALLDDLEQRGLLDSTLVVATGEFGRTPRLNGRGGRDHWPGVWSALAAGCGVPGGQVIGASDRHAAEPADRPVRLVELFATMSRMVLPAGPIITTLTEPGLGCAAPIPELFA